MTTFVNIKSTTGSNYVGDAVFIAENANFNQSTHSDSFLKVPAEQNKSVTFFSSAHDFEFQFGFPTGGTVSSIALKSGNATVATISGLNITVQDASDALQSAGSDGNIDKLIALFGDMRVTGNIGDDILFSGSGDDTILGGRGADFMGGTSGMDTVDYSSSNTRISANLLTGQGAFGNAAGDTYGSIEDLIGGTGGDRLTGNAKGNMLTGNNGNDVLKGAFGGDVLEGGLGNDRLEGGRGHDILRGGAGGDKFYFNALNEGGDTVQAAVGVASAFDFADKIYIKTSAVGADATDHFVSGTLPVAPDAQGSFLFDTDDHILFWDANGSAAGGRTTLLTIVGTGAVQADDIILF